MFTSNPFAALTEIIPVGAMQAYVIAMMIFVVAGTIIDVVHKRSKEYFDGFTKEMEKKAKRPVNNKGALLVQTVTSEVLTSSEFKNPKRRLSHLLTMYGFIFFVASTAVLIFAYGDQPDAGFWGVLWRLGALMLCIGGYWFWFDIRVDVSAEGLEWTDLEFRRDVFILSMLAMCTFALLWSFTDSMLMFALFIASSTLLFTTVIWSKFAHMFFKPAAAYQKKVIWESGARENLPDIPELSSMEVKEKYPDIPTYMGDNPPYMGRGIKREPPSHY